jgi:hypothetical protein
MGFPSYRSQLAAVLVSGQSGGRSQWRQCGKAGHLFEASASNRTPDDITIGSRRDIVWRCQNDHDYEQRPERRNAGYECPTCSGQKLCVGFNDINSRYPEISTEWHPSKNGAIEPCDLTPGNRVFWWKCKSAGHEYQQNAPQRTESHPASRTRRSSHSPGASGGQRTAGGLFAQASRSLGSLHYESHLAWRKLLVHECRSSGIYWCHLGAKVSSKKRIDRWADRAIAAR